MSSRYPAAQGQRDANEPTIILTLENVGTSVHKLPTGEGLPDLLAGGDMPCPNCGFKFPQNKLLEVKRLPHKGVVYKSQVQLNGTQLIWHEAWRGQKCIVRTPEEALEAIGVKHD